MKEISKEEIEKKVLELWGETEKREIRIAPAGFVEITLANMYDPPGCSFAQLKALAEFFDTDQISDAERFGNGGCETCDYGSSYGFTLRVGE